MRGRKAAQIEGIQQYDFDKLAKTEGNARERKGGFWLINLEKIHFDEIKKTSHCPFSTATATRKGAANPLTMELYKPYT